jgi:hypothetical protein
MTSRLNYVETSIGKIALLKKRLVTKVHTQNHFNITIIQNKFYTRKPIYYLVLMTKM